VNIREFKQARSKAVDSNLPTGGWRVYDTYEIVRDAEVGHFVYAPPPPTNIVAYPTDSKGPVVSRWEQDDGIREVYAPLRLDGLFLEFATLVEEAPVDARVVKDWAERYGLLGRPWSRMVTIFGTKAEIDEEEPEWMSCRGTDRLQEVSEFSRTAEEANRCLRLYEAAASEEGPIREDLEFYGISWSEPGKMRKDALFEVSKIVQRNLTAHCYPQLTYNRIDGTSHPVMTWGFHTLQGALFVQMARILTAKKRDIKRCEYPGCTKVVRIEGPKETDPSKMNDRSKGYKTRKDKKFCTPKHRHDYYNEYTRPRKNRTKDSPE
jgi:hypothetical protein